MKQLYPFLSRSQSQVFVSRVVFLLTLLATIVFVVTRIELISSAANAPSATKVVRDGSASTTTVPTSLRIAGSCVLTSPLCTQNPVVVNNLDSGAGSLRRIADACDGSTITFNMASVTSPISLTSAELTISKNLTIAGPGVAALTIQRSANVGTPVPHLQHHYWNTISGMAITNGNAPDGAAEEQSAKTALTAVEFKMPEP